MSWVFSCYALSSVVILTTYIIENLMDLILILRDHALVCIET